MEASNNQKTKRGKPKGRAVDVAALAEVRALLGAAPRRRDLLIEHLHKIQDRYGRISAAHMVALSLAQTRPSLVIRRSILADRPSSALW